MSDDGKTKSFSLKVKEFFNPPSRKYAEDGIKGAIYGGLALIAGTTLGFLFTMFGGGKYVTGAPDSSAIPIFIELLIIIFLVWKVHATKATWAAGLLFLIWLLEFLTKMSLGTLNIGWGIAWLCIGILLLGGVINCRYIKRHPA